MKQNLFSISIFFNIVKYIAAPFIVKTFFIHHCQPLLSHKRFYSYSRAHKEECMNGEPKSSCKEKLLHSILNTQTIHF